ncbi:unnamed protein product, partial [marine sediment metagenome]
AYLHNYFTGPYELQRFVKKIGISEKQIIEKPN